jgi:phospho-N-acetylmuramoyl-pentapeptide-transferase
MLYHLLYSLSDDFTFFNVFRYITFRIFLAGSSSFVLTLILGPFIIKRLKKLQISQVVRNDGPKTHLSKAGTPTMGGVVMLSSIIISTLLWADLSNMYIWILIFIMSFYGLIGWIDDMLKIKKLNSKGIGSRNKFLLQVFGVICFFIFSILFTDLSFNLRFPFFKTLNFNLGFFALFLYLLVIVGSSNAVNLTDGLDGLAIGPVMTTAVSLMILSYCSGHYNISEYLQIPFVKESGEISIFCSAIVMSGLGFLWFNTYPAQVFMGDIGSLSLGASLGAVAIFTKNEILLVVIGGVFVLEAISVMVQVVSFKLTGKRMFRMAPLHHHFELKGWAEPKVIVRFWIISIVLAVVGLATLKLR